MTFLLEDWDWDEVGYVQCSCCWGLYPEADIADEEGNCRWCLES